jgi:hypothetical protein
MLEIPIMGTCNKHMPISQTSYLKLLKLILRSKYRLDLDTVLPEPILELPAQTATIARFRKFRNDVYRYGGKLGLSRGQIRSLNELVCQGVMWQQCPDMAYLPNIDCPITQLAIKNDSAQFETSIGAALNQLGIKFMTENELGNEQLAIFGRRIMTPDFLFTEPVIINGIEVHWLECKNYLGCDLHFILQANLAQATKYYSTWGTGAFMYAQGYTEGLIIPGALVLDARNYFF